MDKRKRKGLILLILGVIIILLTVVVMVVIFAPLGSWGYGLAQIAFYFFIAIGALITLIGLGYLLVRKAQDK